ncbi:accessory Sec system glycosyltransferase GtfA [Streptococcus suis]|nr:accessory Sec system glycosyltransferase GtfA [Streptococcus suis]
MTIYNINLGIGWASSGVEYAQAYRYKVFNRLGEDSKFVFMDFISSENISDLTRNIGFADKDVIWLYTHFTDQKIAPTTFTLSQLRELYAGQITQEETVGTNIVRLYYAEEDTFLTAYLKKDSEDIVHRVEFVSRGILIRKDYFTYVRSFSEYYSAKDGQAHLYQRRFFNEDGTVAYDELLSEDNKNSMFLFDGLVLYSKEELVSHFMQTLSLTEKDIVILDRETGIGQSIFTHVKPAKLGVVIHAEHYSANHVTESTILWNNYYEYQFTNADKVDFFIAATKRQKEVVEAHFEKFTTMRPYVVDIPVGSLEHLSKPEVPRKPFSIVTASRLAVEKHIDWLTKAVIAAKEVLPELTLDIYGEGTQRGLVSNIIREASAESYIQLKGHQNLDEVYPKYEVYLSASKSEGFGLTLLEAIGAGLPIIGFDVPYGNQTFIREGENGYLIPVSVNDDEFEIQEAFKEAIIKLFTSNQLDKMHHVSYEIASQYLTEKVEEKWRQLIKEMA